jgi:peptide/nickel transport system substrate-binding protein/oligopeptide transport system substrate-binding protein
MKKLPAWFAVILCFVISCQQEPAESPEKAQPEVKIGGVYRAPLPWSPRTLDPSLSTDIYAVTLIQQIYDGLVQFDQNLNVMPALATSWTVSRDRLTYTFTLRKDARFHNGRSVTADDFVYSFTRILDPKQESSALNFFERVKGAAAYRNGESKEVTGLKALDAHTFEVTIDEPYAPFLSVLAMISSKVVPKEEVKRWGKQFGYHPVGTGPFRLESWDEDRIVLRANHDYHEGRPYLDRVEFTVYEGSQNEKIFQDFQMGLLEEALVFGGIREQIAKSPKYLFVRKPTLSLLFYGMNCRTEPLNNHLVRQTLNYAINKERIVREVYRNRFVVANTLLPPGMPGYFPENAFFTHDAQKARKLLEQAGYGPGRPPLALTLLSASRSQAAQKEFELLTNDLAEVGISLQVKYETDWSAFEEQVRQGNFLMYRYAYFADVPDPDNFLGMLCGSTSPYNFMGYGNQKVDALLAEALTRVDVLKRAAIYREVEALILEDAAMVPLLYLTFESVFQPYVKGVQISALGAPYIPLKKIWLDKH